jgi:alpha-galactosidase
MTENGYVRGHLALWDELRRRNPGLRIDSCASGGRRDDLESMRRAVPLLRSDFQFPEMKGVVEGNQGHTYGLSSWLPFQGTGCYLYDSYSARSFYLAGFGMGGLSTENAAAQRQAYAEC